MKKLSIAIALLAAAAVCASPLTHHKNSAKGQSRTAPSTIQADFPAPICPPDLRSANADPDSQLVCRSELQSPRRVAILGARRGIVTVYPSSVDPANSLDAYVLAEILVSFRLLREGLLRRYPFFAGVLDGGPIGSLVLLRTSV